MGLWILPLDRYLPESRAAARGRVNDRRVDHVGRTEIEEPLMEKFDPDRRMGFKNLISLPRRTRSHQQALEDATMEGMSIALSF